MPKSKRGRVYNLSKVGPQRRARKDALFQRIRGAVAQHQNLFVLGFDNMRNNHLKDVRQELKDSRLFLGKTKLMVRALGQTPDDALAPGLDKLAPYIFGNVALLFTNRDPASVTAYFDSFSPVDFARAGAVAPRDFVVPAGVVYATAGEVPLESDVPMPHSTEPELRKLGMPTRLIKGKIVLGDENGEGQGYVVCKEGEVLDSRQTRLLKLFDVCLSEFRVKILAYWNAASGEVTAVDPDAMDGLQVADAVEDED